MNYTGYGAQGGAAPQKPRWEGDKVPSGYKTAQLQNFTPEQMQLFSQLFGNVSPDSYLSRLASGDESIFKEIEAPARREFEGILGEAGSRFSGLGMGARRGSGFNQNTGQLVSNFAQDLSAKRQGLQRQALLDLHGISQDLLNQRPYDRTLVRREQNPWVDIAGKFAGAIPGAVAGYFSGGPIGALQGANAGLNLFSGGGTTFIG